MQDGGAFPRETQIFEADSPAGILKWNLLWGEIPFLELLYIDDLIVEIEFIGLSVCRNNR